ncbi:hypothetical protein N8354_04360, partial [Flavobacteriaceae bacterium]|nr:hypothetical protein [Flavobacteriaceae bacterium]
MNKSILFIIFLVCCSANLIYSQAPEGINFQAVARDGNGNVASERTIYVQVDLKVDRDSNNAVYSESFNVVSSKEGIFSVIIGNGSRLSGVDNIIDLDWGSVIYYLNLNVAVSPSLYDPEWNYIDEYVDLGTSQIWSVPYAFAANTAKTIDGILSSDQGGTGVNNNGKTISLEGNLSLLGENNLTINTTADSNITLPISGTLATVSDVENRIVDVNITTSSIQSELDATQTGAGLGIDGTYTADSSTNYISVATSLTAADTALDTQISANTTNIATNANTINANASTATNLQSELDATQTGAGLGIDGTYTADSSTNYISVATSLTAADTALDTQINSNATEIQQLNNQKLNLSGGVMTGTLDMGNNTITNLKNPINNQDVVNKQYVDTAVTQIDITKLQIGLEEGKIFVGDSSDLAKAVNATGDISIANSGVVSIADNAVSSAKILDGTITSTDIANESILDQSLATISTAGKVANTATTANENNVANTIVLRDSNGDFSAETITADVLGNASTASKLQSPVTIAGQSFDGSTNIQIAPNDLAGVTADANEINVLDGITPSTVELNYVDGTTSNIQNQLNAKATN